MAFSGLDSPYCARNYDPLPVMLTRGEGAYLWDVAGRRYIDMMSAYSAVSLGHAHPRILAKLSEQAHRLAVPSRAYYNDRLNPFLEALCKLTGLDAALPMNTGAEAVETAIKAARRWGQNVKGVASPEIIVAERNFHGRTTTVISFSSDEDYREGFGPFTPGFRLVPFGDLEATRAAISERTVAVLVEPIQGEAGVIVPPRGWLAGLRRLCDEKRILLLLDEVQSGLGRTGACFAYQHENVLPDGVMLGKALGGGVLPVSAFVARREVMDVFTPGSHGSTFGATLWPPLSDSRRSKSSAMRVSSSAAEPLALICCSACKQFEAQRSWPFVVSDSGRARNSSRAFAARARFASASCQKACCRTRRIRLSFASRRPS